MHALMPLLLALASLGAEPAETAQKPPLIEPKALGQPCMAANYITGTAVYNPEGDFELLVLSSANETGAMELVFINPGEKQYSKVAAPAGSGAWALTVLPPGDKVAAGTYYDGRLLVFDMPSWSFTANEAFPGAAYIWNFAQGGDGRAYFGTANGGKLGVLNPSNFQVEDCGAPMPPNQSVRRVTALPGGRILCSLGVEQPGVKIYNPADKTFADAPDTFSGVTSGVAWNGYFVSGSTVYDGELKPVSPPPFPVPAPEKGPWSVAEEVSTDKALYLRQGVALHRVDAGQEGLKTVYDFDLRGGRLVAPARDGGVYGIRGLKFFHIPPGATYLDPQHIKLQPPVRPVFFLAADPARGFIWGGPPLGQTVFLMNRETGVSTNTDIVCDGYGEVYGMVFLGAYGFGVSYAGGDIFKYNPDMRWDQFNRTNPYTIASLGGRGYIRPVGGIVAGPDNKLYSGWMAGVGVYGGAVAVTDPASGNTDLIENPLGKQAVSGMAVDESHIYLGTSLEANGLPRKTGEPPQFGVLGIDTRQPYLNIPFEGAAAVDRMALSTRAKRVAFAVDGALKIFDTENLKLVDTAPGAPKITSTAMTCPGGNAVYYGSDRQIVQYDLANNTHKVISELPGPVGPITGEPYGDLFVACGADVFRIGIK